MVSIHSEILSPPPISYIFANTSGQPEYTSHWYWLLHHALMLYSWHILSWQKTAAVYLPHVAHSVHDCVGLGVMCLSGSGVTTSYCVILLGTYGIHCYAHLNWTLLRSICGYFVNTNIRHTVLHGHYTSVIKKVILRTTVMIIKLRKLTKKSMMLTFYFIEYLILI